MPFAAKPEPKIGRIRAAWYVLCGQRVTPQQIQAEWVEYQQIFNDLLERWSAKLARDSKAEQARIKRLDLAPQETSPALVETKADLRRKVAQMRGFGLLDAKDWHNQTSEVRNEPDS